MKTYAFILITFVSYYLTARMGLELATISKQASPVWPATGVAMTFIYLFGPRMGLGIFLGALLSNFQTGLPLLAASTIALGNTLEAVLGMWAFQRLSRNEFDYGVHTKAIVAVFVLFFAAAISASVGVITLVKFQVIPFSAAPHNWLTWWVGDFLGALFLIPIAYKIKMSGRDVFRLSSSQLIKFILLLVLTFSILFFVFYTFLGSPFILLVFFCVLLAIAWLDSFYAYLISLLIGIFSIWQTVAGNGPFAGALLNESLIHLQIFLAGLGLTTLGLGSLRQEGLLRVPMIALIFGWIVAGATFYYSYTTTLTHDQKLFAEKTIEVGNALESKMNSYVRVLESGVSFIDASEHVSKEEWRLFSKSILATNRYEGIEGVGVIFSSSIGQRIKSGHARSYARRQKQEPVSKASNIQENLVPDDQFLITYIEPIETNYAAVGFNISTEKMRYEAAIKARDTGQPTITGNIVLVQDQQNRPGALILVPFYANGFSLNSPEERRQAFLGFVYATVILEKFLNAAASPFFREISLQSQDFNYLGGLTPDAISQSMKSKWKLTSSITIVDRKIEVTWMRGPAFKSYASLFSSWIGFFGALFSLLIAFTLSSLQLTAIRAKKIAQEMTSEINERRLAWQALTETSPVGIYTTDQNGLCNYVNSAWEKITGLAAADAMGEGWFRALHPDDVTLVSESWNQLTTGGEFNCGYRFLRKDGSIRHVNGLATPILGPQGDLTGYLGTIQDVSELHHKQVSLVTSSRLSSLGQMASGIAHEINNPLAIIQAKASLISKMMDGSGTWQPEKAKSNLAQISETVQRIAKIIRGLQAMARNTEMEPFQESSLAQVLDDAIELCREKFKNNGIELIIEGLSESQSFFWGRPEQISQVFLNLINNAFDAAMTSEKKWVRVELRESPESVLAVISDSGAGIPPTVAAKIFDPFFTSKEIGKGTGLGLSISRGLVEKHNGRIFLDTSKLETSFILELPKHTKIQDT